MTDSEQQGIDISRDLKKLLREVIRPRKVSRSQSMNRSSDIRPGTVHSQNTLSLTPNDELVFEINSTAGQNNGLVAKLQINNTAPKPVLFKITTTRPERYGVKPCTSQMKIGGSCDVEIHVHQTHLNEETLAGDIVISQEVLTTLMKDRFLVTAITLEEDAEENLTQSQLTNLIKPVSYTHLTLPTKA